MCLIKDHNVVVEFYSVCFPRLWVKQVVVGQEHNVCFILKLSAHIVWTATGNIYMHKLFLTTSIIHMRLFGCCATLYNKSNAYLSRYYLRVTRSISFKKFNSHCIALRKQCCLRGDNIISTSSTPTWQENSEFTFQKS